MIYLDAERFIAEAIESVLGQTYPHWELLLVDDGSADAGPTIAQACRSRDPARIHCLSHPGGSNLGMSASRNLGIGCAVGEYFAFLDADDVWAPDKLERQIALLHANPQAGMVYGPTLNWFSWSGRDGDRCRDHPGPLGVRPNQLINPPELIPRFLKGRAQPPSTCSFLARMDAVRRTGGFETEFRGMFEDQAFFYKFFLSETAYVTDLCLDRYRKHEDSATAQAQAAGRYHHSRPNVAHHDFLCWFERHLDVLGHFDPAIRRALAAAQWHYRHPKLSRLRRRLLGLASKPWRFLRSLIQGNRWNS